MLRKILIFFIKLYRKYISPLKKSTCRFYPTCSQYAIDAINEYGGFKGSAMAVRRLLRCHPWNPGGYDPVDKKKETKNDV